MPENLDRPDATWQSSNVVHQLLYAKMVVDTMAERKRRPTRRISEELMSMQVVGEAIREWYYSLAPWVVIIATIIALWLAVLGIAGAMWLGLGALYS